MPWSDLQLNDCCVEDGGVVGVEGNAFLRVEGHAGLAALGEGDRVALARAEVVVDDERFGALARLADEREAVLHLDEQVPSADERLVTLRQGHPAYDLPYPHAASSCIARFTSSDSSRL